MYSRRSQIRTAGAGRGSGLGSRRVVSCRGGTSRQPSDVAYQEALVARSLPLCAFGALAVGAVNWHGRVGWWWKVGLISLLSATSTRWHGGAHVRSAAAQCQTYQNAPTDRSPPLCAFGAPAVGAVNWHGWGRWWWKVGGLDLLALSTLAVLATTTRRHGDAQVGSAAAVRRTRKPRPALRRYVVSVPSRLARSTGTGGVVVEGGPSLYSRPQRDGMGWV